MTDVPALPSPEPGSAASSVASPGAAQAPAPSGINRRMLLGAGMALGADAIRPAHAGPDAIQTGYANGPAAVADAFFFPGFRQSFVTTPGTTINNAQVPGATINTLVGGKGPPLLLLHGHPETHVAWHKVAAQFTVVLTDLRGYGDSSKPDGGPGHVNYSKRAMGNDQVAVMKSLGFDTFQAVGHDRGGRGHLIAEEAPDALLAALHPFLAAS